MNLKTRIPPTKCCGLTRPELLIVFAVLSLIAVMFLVSRSRPRSTSERVTCTRNLKQIALAFGTWADEHGDKFPMGVPESNGGSLESAASGELTLTFVRISNHLISPSPLLCPDDRSRHPGAKSFRDVTDQKISYFIALDAAHGASSHVLSGDRHIGDHFEREVSGLLLLTNYKEARWTKLLHKGEGNVAYADGSVEQATTRDLQSILAGTGFMTNRLVVP